MSDVMPDVQDHEKKAFALNFIITNFHQSLASSLQSQTNRETREKLTAFEQGIKYQTEELLEALNRWIEAGNKLVRELSDSDHNNPRH